ncbi:iron-sulfur cluster repair di-iron protein [bacterium]|nr:MAG: iron-sulfur cluster repair di-iron protein [bacterium]
MESIDNLTLSEIVIKYPFSANIFEKHRLDFCCGGKKTLSAACAENGIDVAGICGELAQANNQASYRSDKIEFNDMNLSLLIDYIESNHHAYVRNAIPVIQAHLQKVVNAHGKNHPEMKKINEHFDDVADEMAMHMKKEEQMLFPYIRQMAESHNKRHIVEPPAFKTVRNPISVMEFEHERAGQAMAKIRTISHNYEPPADACTTFRLCLTELDEFERDLHKHVHLENNILFPKAVTIENALIKVV